MFAITLLLALLACADNEHDSGGKLEKLQRINELLDEYYYMLENMGHMAPPSSDRAVSQLYEKWRPKYYVMFDKPNERTIFCIAENAHQKRVFDGIPRKRCERVMQSWNDLTKKQCVAKVADWVSREATADKDGGHNYYWNYSWAYKKGSGGKRKCHICGVTHDKANVDKKDNPAKWRFHTCVTRFDECDDPEGKPNYVGSDFVSRKTLLGLGYYLGGPDCTCSDDKEMECLH